MFCIVITLKMSKYGAQKHKIGIALTHSFYFRNGNFQRNPHPPYLGRSGDCGVCEDLGN